MPDAASADLELAREALLTITTADTIGEPLGSTDEGDGVTTVYFATTMRSYTGWRWTVSIAHVDGLEPSVLEAELTPGEGALLSPDWVPWADRMAEYRAAQAAAKAAASDGDGDGDGDDDADDDADDDDEFDGDDRDDDFDDDDDFGIHDLDDDDDVDDDFRERDDVDGVSIDELAPDAGDVGVDEADDAEPDADEVRPEPELGTRRPRSRKKQQGDESE